MEASSEHIMSCAKEIYKAAMAGMSRDSLLSEYREFYETYPKIFDGCLQKGFDFEMLDFMLKSREHLKHDKKDVNEVDSHVIGHLKEIYVNPILRKMNIPTDQEPDKDLMKKFDEAVRAAAVKKV